MIRCIVWVSQRFRPGAEAPRWSAVSSRSVVTTILAGIPAARWTTYGEVVMSGSGVPNAWRVLQAGGTVASQFRWDDPGRHDDPRELLRREGVCFEDKGRASEDQFIDAAGLALFAGLDVDSESVRRRSGGRRRQTTEDP